MLPRELKLAAVMIVASILLAFVLNKILLAGGYLAGIAALTCAILVVIFSSLSVSPGDAIRLRAVVGGLVWLTFTVFLAAGGMLIPQYILGPHYAFGFIQILADGRLFVVSGVIAADAMGRFVRCLALRRFSGRNHRQPWWCWLGAVGSLICLLMVSNYAVAVVVFRSNPTTEIPPFAYAATAWFLLTVVAAGLTVVGTEVMTL